jgi:hypothetical protein
MKAASASLFTFKASSFVLDSCDAVTGLLRPDSDGGTFWDRQHDLLEGQFEGGRTLAHLEKVLDALRSHDPWMQLIFFINGNDRLNGRSPLQLLRAGELEPVLRAAESYGEQGAA